MWIRLRLFAIIYTVSISASVTAQVLSVERAALDTTRMNVFLNRESARLSSEAWERIGSRDKIRPLRKELLREFRVMLGLEPMPERTPMHVTTVRTVHCDGYTIEVLYYQSLPGVYVTANLYRPEGETCSIPGCDLGAWAFRP